MSASRALFTAALVGALGTSSGGGYGQVWLPSLDAIALGLDPVFGDGFESEECAFWSATSNPIGAPDFDDDGYGDLAQPTAYCQLPAGFVANAIDCNDADAGVHPGAQELCNGVDDDCDAGSPDGSDDPEVGASCDGDDGDQCIEGVRFCDAGSLSCSDATGTTMELCAGDGVDEDCDGSIDEGFVVNGNPACESGTLDLGAVSGDTGTGQLGTFDYRERWIQFTLGEDDTGIPTNDLRASIVLTPPAGSDFDLFVYCVSCGGSLVGSSTSGGAGGTEAVFFGGDDTGGTDDSITLVVEVRYFSGGPCANWFLQILGNAGSGASECP